jgi:hypothetical protein
MPLKLGDQGAWTSDEHTWGEEDEPIEEVRANMAWEDRREEGWP